VSRICREVQAELPGFAHSTLPRWRRGLVQLHLRRCQDCRGELQRQRALDAALHELGTAAAAAAEAPPAGLIDILLEQADRPGVRGRAAVPARGAVSGARPALSVTLLILGAAAGTAAGYATWRGTRAVQARFRKGSLL